MRYDTMLESTCWNASPRATTWTRWRKRYLGYDTISYEDVAGKGAKQIRSTRSTVDTARRVLGRGRRRHAAAAPGAVAAARSRCRRCSSVYEEIEHAARAGAAAHGAQRRADRRERAARAEPASSRKRMLRAGAAGARAGRPRLQPRVAQAARQILFEQAAAAGAGEDADRRSRRPTRTCWRSSPTTTRCRA